MQPPAALLLVALAGSAWAFIEAGFAVLPTVTPTPVARRDSFDCASAITSFSAAMPHVTSPALASWLRDYNNDELDSALSSLSRTKAVSDVPGVCSVLMNPPPAPASLSSGASSYQSAMSSWAASATPQVSTIVSKCSGVGPSGLVEAGLELVIATDVPQCTSAFNKFNEALGGTSSTGKKSSASTASPRPLAAIAGVAAVAAAVALF